MVASLLRSQNVLIHFFGVFRRKEIGGLTAK
jgi:hypothetical protein